MTLLEDLQALRELVQQKIKEWQDFKANTEHAVENANELIEQTTEMIKTLQKTLETINTTVTNVNTTVTTLNTDYQVLKDKLRKNRWMKWFGLNV
jgi:phage shock protein A